MSRTTSGKAAAACTARNPTRACRHACDGRDGADMAMRHRLFSAALVLLAALLLAGCGGDGGAYFGSPLEGLGKSFRIGANPAEITIPAGGKATATLEMTCVFNTPSIDIAVTNSADLTRAQLVVAPRTNNRACTEFHGARNGAGDAIYEGAVAWPITVLDDAMPGRYAVEFVAEARGERIENTERTSLVIVVTEPKPGGFSLVVPPDALVRELAQPANQVRSVADIAISVVRAEHAGFIDFETSGVDAGGA